MKIVDKTPYQDEKGEISLIDRGKILMKYGKLWMDEVDAQKAVLPTFEAALDKSFTILRNVTLPGLDAAIPFILVGPTGVFVIYVTPLMGMYRAKGDQWGTITGNVLKPEKPNLLMRTEQMARAVQVYLQRHGYSELTIVESILLFSDPGVHVDSLRPIVRVVMRDALERMVVSIAQARMVLSPEAVYNIVNLILNPPQPKEEIETNVTSLEGIPLSGSDLGASPAAPLLPEKPRRKTFTRKQWIFLGAMFVIWCLIMAVFAFFVIKDLIL